jgi:diguanylate cyclase (GGDEF)-like protein
VEFSALSAASDRVIDAVDRNRNLLTQFSTLRSRIEDLIDNQLFPLVLSARQQVQGDVSFSISFAIWFLLSMTLFGVVVGATASIALTHGLVKPIIRLTEGAEAIGQGKFDHRIDIRSDDEMGRLAASFNRMAHNRQEAEAALRQQAYHDTLTKLPNRMLFQIRLAEALDNARRIDRIVAVHCLDLNKFKDVNDTLGHPVGDLLLQQVSERPGDCIRKSDTVARLGGDEFAIIQTNLVHNNGITVLAARVIDSLATPFDLGGERVFSGTSIGISTYPHDGAEADALLKNADLALYRAKHEGLQEGQGKYVLFDDAMNAEVQARKSLETDIRQALDEDEFFVNYQPQINITSGRIVGVEALVRWKHPQRGMVSPGEFISVAEHSGLITRLTETVLTKACAQIRLWQDAGLPPFRVSVNLPPTDFKRKDIVALITRVLEENDVDPQYLELEITEGMVMSGADTVIATLKELHDLGIDLAIDDFGTGFSSMSYLKQFPVDRLKIDQAFVADVLSNNEDASITDAIINLGHNFGLTVIAEGVETSEQLEFLHRQGCDEAQGYFLSRPLGPDAIVQFFDDFTMDALTDISNTA